MIKNFIEITAKYGNVGKYYMDDNAIDIFLLDIENSKFGNIIFKILGNINYRNIKYNAIECNDKYLFLDDENLNKLLGYFKAQNRDNNINSILND